MCIGMFEPLDAAEADWMNIAVTSAGTYLVVSSDGGETWTVVSPHATLYGVGLLSIDICHMARQHLLWLGGTVKIIV